MSLGGKKAVLCEKNSFGLQEPCFDPEVNPSYGVTPYFWPSLAVRKPEKIENFRLFWVEKISSGNDFFGCFMEF